MIELIIAVTIALGQQPEQKVDVPANATEAANGPVLQDSSTLNV